MIRLSICMPVTYLTLASLTLYGGCASESESGYISSSHIRLIRCLAVIGQASFTREHLV